MRTTKANQSALLLGVGLGAYFEGMLFHPIAGFFYFVAWALSVAGVVMLWSSMRGPGPLPAGRAFIGSYLIGWGAFNIVEALARHDLSTDWLLFGTGVGFVVLGFVLQKMREDAFLERRSGFDRRSALPLR